MNDKQILRQSIYSGSEHVSPENPNPLTQEDFGELKRLDEKLRGSDSGLKSIEKIREKLFPDISAKPKEIIIPEQAKSVESGQAAIIGNTLQSNRKGIQERLSEVQRGKWNSIKKEKAANAREILAGKAPDRGGR